MKKFHLFTFIIFTIASYSQNLEVDKRNGFKDIKLGTHFSNFAGIKELPLKSSNKIVGLWNTSDKNLGYFFDDKIDYFELTFDKENKELIAIQVVLLIKKPYLEPSVFNKFKEITDKLIISLGKPDGSGKETKSFFWYGKETIMSFSLSPEQLELDDNGNTVGLTSLKLAIMSHKKLKNDIEKGF